MLLKNYDLSLFGNISSMKNKIVDEEIYYVVFSYISSPKWKWVLWVFASLTDLSENYINISGIRLKEFYCHNKL